MTTALVVPSTIGSDRVTTLESAKTGRAYGTRIVFGSAIKASDIKASLKASDKNLKGAALTRKVNEVLTGKTTLAWAEHEVMVSALRSSGYQPDSMDVRKAGGTVRFVKPVEPKANVSKVVESIKAMSTEEREALKALLFASE